MARRAAAPVASPASQAGRSAAQAIKKLPKVILWVTSIFVLIGLILAGPFGVFGGLITWAADPSRNIGVFFLAFVGFFIGLSGIFILFLRFVGFEDVQEAGRSVLASTGIGILAALVVRWASPMFVGNDTLLKLFMVGVIATAMTWVINIFLKNAYPHIIGWGASVIAVAFICLLFVNMTDGKGFEIGWGGWGNKSADSGPKTIRLNPLNTTETFSNLSGPLSNRFEASARAESLRWTLEEGSSCGVVIINDTHRVRQCPEEKEIPSLRAAGVLRPYENMHTLQFEGVGMAGKVTAAW